MRKWRVGDWAWLLVLDYRWREGSRAPPVVRGGTVLEVKRNIVLKDTATPPKRWCFVRVEGYGTQIESDLFATREEAEAELAWRRLVR